MLGRDYDDFVDLVSPDSDISHIIMSKAFQKPPPKLKKRGSKPRASLESAELKRQESTLSTGQEEEKSAFDTDHMAMQIDITRLLLFGLMYCKGSHEEKTQRFWDVIQQPGMDQISWEDKELTVAGTWFLEVATHWTHVWTQ